MNTQNDGTKNLNAAKGFEDCATYLTATGKDPADIGMARIPKKYLDAKQCIDLQDFVATSNIDTNGSGCVAMSQHGLNAAQVREVWGAFSDEFTGNDADLYKAVTATLAARDEVPTRLYRGTTYTDSSGSKVKYHNLGHMGTLDHFQSCSRLFGAFVYNSTPDPTNTGKLFGN